MSDPVKLGVLRVKCKLTADGTSLSSIVYERFTKNMFSLASSVCLSGFPSMKLTKEQLLPNKGPLIASCQTEEALWLWLL